jgi:hypothetical protein
MDKEQLIKIIKENPQLTYKEIEAQAQAAGVPLDLLEKAWREAHAAHKKGKKLLVFLFIILALGGGGYYWYYTHTPGPIKSETVQFESGPKSAKDCLGIAKKYIDEWSSNYALGGISLLKNPEEEYPDIGKAKMCRVDILGKSKGASEILLTIDENQIIIDSQDGGVEPSPYYKPEGMPTIIDSTEMLDFAKKNQQFNSDLEGLVASTGKSEKEIVDIHALTRAMYTQDNELMWWVALKDGPRYLFNALTGEFVKRDERRGINAEGGTKEKPKMPIISTKEVYADFDTTQTWEALLGKLEKVNGDSSGMYFENYDSGMKTAQDCLNIGSARASIWSKDYRLVGLSMDRLDQDSINNGISAVCEVAFQSGGNDESLNLSFGMQGITYAIKKSMIQEDHFSPLSAPKEIIDTPEIAKQLEDGGSLNGHIASFTLIFDRNKQKYVWIITFADKSETSKDATL